MLHFLFLLVMPTVSQAQATEDSLLIYNAYKTSIQTLKATNDYRRWYAVSDSLDSVTACAFRRLSVYNKEEYKPIDTYNKEGFGETYCFPAPSQKVQHNEEAAPVKGNSFTIMDHQTKFIVKNDGKTKIPYIECLHFDESHHLTKVDKVNPSMFYNEGLLVSVE
jgi:hypothetical protein